MSMQSTASVSQICMSDTVWPVYSFQSTLSRILAHCERTDSPFPLEQSVQSAGGVVSIVI